MFKSHVKPVFLYHYYYTKVTKWNCLKSKLPKRTEAKEHTYKMTNYFNWQNRNLSPPVNKKSTSKNLVKTQKHMGII